MTEEIFQANCYEWFHNNMHSHRKMLFHVDNNSHNSVMGNKKRALGVNAGISDFIFINYFAVDFIELKIKGGSQSDDQKEFQRKIKERGHKYHLVYAMLPDYSDGLQTFKNIINAALANS